MEIGHNKERPGMPCRVGVEFSWVIFVSYKDRVKNGKIN